MLHYETSVCLKSPLGKLLSGSKAIADLEYTY